MIRRKGFENKINERNPPVVLDVCGVVSIESMDMYICISAMKAVWGFVSRIYRRILRKSEQNSGGPTWLRERVRVKKKAKNASVMFVFTCFTVDGSRVGHDLVLVFAATRRHLALRAARLIEQACRPPC